MLIVTLLGIVAIPTISAGAQPAPSPSPPTLQGVLKALGLDNAPADYVVVVDTSGSMQDAGLYPRVRDALAAFLTALRPADHLSLLTFDSAATLRFTGEIGADPQRALAQLPLTADGKATDIGAGIDAGLAELERPGAHEVGAVVLMTDGKHDPLRGSAYPTTSGPAWDSLVIRARRLSARHHVSSYALALGRAQTTDAALLKSTFPQTVVVAIPSDQVSDYLGRVTQQLRLDSARRAIEPDLKGEVEATWDRPLSNLDLDSTSANATLLLHSKLVAVPITVSHLAAQVSNPGIVVAGLPDSVDLAPGQTITLPVRFHLASGEGFGFGAHQVSQTGRLNVTGTISTSWQGIMDRDLGLSFGPSLESQPVDLIGIGTRGWSYPRIALTFLLPLLVLFGAALLAWRLYQGGKPSLRGVLIATPSVGFPVRGTLAGRKVPIGAINGSRLEIPGQGYVTGKRVAKRGKRKGFDLELQIAYATETRTKTKHGSCRPNSSTVVDGVTFTYQSNARS